MLTDYQKDKIARKLWIEYLQCALRDGAAQCDMRDVQDVLKQTYALANMEHKKQFRRRPKLRVVQ